MNMRLPFWIVVLVAVGHANLHSQAGSAGLAFLKLGVGGRALGMGEASTALASDPSSAYYNPASLALSQYSQLLFTHKEWIQGVKTEYIAGTASLHRLTLGVGINETSVGDIEVRSIPGPPLETFAARNAAIGISAAYQFDPSVSIGMTGKFLYEKILVYEASGYAFDLGGVYSTPWNVRFGVSIDNLGSMNALDQESSSLPTIVRAGASYQTDLESIEGGLLTVASDVVTLANEHTTHLHLGTELEFRHVFALRAGYQSGYEAKHFSGGIGVRYGLLHVDYAFVPFQDDLGSTHTFSLGIELQ